MRPIIQSILDNDLYAFTMGQASLNLYPNVVTEDVLIIRKAIKFPAGFAEELKRQINLMANLQLQPEEEKWFGNTCSSYIKKSFLIWLRSYRFDPSEVSVEQSENGISVNIRGLFHRTVYWETPLMSLISELYYEMTGAVITEDYISKAHVKGARLRKLGARYSEFGARRRRSFEVQKNVTQALIDSSGRAQDGGVLNGTSNVYLAYLLGLVPMGTNAHKWYQLHAGLYGVRMANIMALDAWEKEYDTRLGIALTDTFTTWFFLETFDRHHAMLYDGVRQDSGDPIAFADMIIEHYKKLGIVPMSKTILFSDSLDIEMVEKILNHCAGKINCAFGIGTFFSNDFEDLPALKIVIKQVAVYLHNGRRICTVKLSDDPEGKASGDPVAIEHAKYEVGLYSHTLS